MGGLVFGMVYFDCGRGHRVGRGIAGFDSSQAFHLEGVFQTLEQTGVLSCSLLIIITFGNLFSFVLSSSGAIDNFVSFITGLDMSPLMILLLIIGCIL